jgi:glutamate synthase (NADPH/NADH) small chain
VTLLSEKRPETDQYERPSVEVLIDRCAGCQECVVRCPTEALTMDVATWTALPVPDRCVGCRQCERTCPFSAIVVSGPVLAGSRTVPDVEVPAEVLGSWVELRPGLSAWDEVLAEASRCLDCPDPTCVRGCPAHNDIPGFLRALRSGDVDAAAAVLAQTSTMPDVCARVCDQQLQCEGACSWSLAGAAPFAIGKKKKLKK